jgi:hypothetical protein
MGEVGGVPEFRMTQASSGFSLGARHAAVMLHDRGAFLAGFQVVGLVNKTNKTRTRHGACLAKIGRKPAWILTLFLYKTSKTRCLWVFPVAAFPTG